MADRTEIDLERIRQEAARLAETSRQLAEAFQKMRDAALEHDGCWGDDNLGKNFAGSYVGPATEVLRNTDAAQRNLHQVSGVLSDVPDRFEGVDTVHARELSRTTPGDVRTA